MRLDVFWEIEFLEIYLYAPVVIVSPYAKKYPTTFRTNPFFNVNLFLFLVFIQTLVLSHSAPKPLPYIPPRTTFTHLLPRTLIPSPYSPVIHWDPGDHKAHHDQRLHWLCKHSSTQQEEADAAKYDWGGDPRPIWSFQDQAP